jgi:hypothetical protein
VDRGDRLISGADPQESTGTGKSHVVTRGCFELK